MSALTMLVLSVLVIAVFLCSAAFLSFVIALTYPTVKQSVALSWAGKSDASLHVDFVISGAIFAGCVLTPAFGAVVMALNISSAEDAALYAATLLSAGLGYWVGR